MSRESSRVLLASAGTGKTFQLTNRLLELYATGARPERVLASTFTRKAAGEILQGLIERLCKATESEEKSALLAQEIGVELDLARASRLCVDLLLGIDRLRISTLDAWFKESVQRDALDFGLPPDLDVSDPAEERRLCARALSRTLDRPRSPAEWSTLISDLERGGAESRVHAGLLGGLSQAARFARDCAAQAWDFPPPVADLAPADFDRAVGALEALELPRTQAGKPRKRYQDAVAKAVRCLRDADWRGFGSLILVSRVLEGSLEFDNCEIPGELADALRTLSRRAAHHLARLVRAQNGAMRALAADFVEELDRAAQEDSRLSFDALPRLLAARSAERARPAGIDHLLLDEFQDTSSLQWRALEPGVRSTLEREQASFFCVGDVKQSIYGWRDGNPRLLEQLPAHLEVAKTTMADNRRSAPAVIDFVNQIFESIGENPALADAAGSVARAGFQANFERHRATKVSEGRVRMWACGQFEDARLVRPREEARLARGVELAQELREAHPEWSIAFLLRNKKLAPELLERLARAGIDASGEGGNPLTDSSAVNAALSLLEFADHPADDFLAFHLATSPLAPVAGIGFPASPAQRAEAARELRRRWLDLGPAGFFAELEPAVRERYGAFDQRRFARLVALAQRLEPSERLRPARFAERVAEERVPDPAGSRTRVMTVHGAKGLQFDAVILLDLDTPLNRAEGGVIAHRRDGDPRLPYDVVTHTLSKEESVLLPELQQVQLAAKALRLQEELCVLYVALTRAVEHLELVIDYPGDKLAKTSFAGIVLQGLGVDPVQPESLLWDDHWEQPLTRAETVGGEPRPSPAAGVAARSPHIGLVAGAGPIGSVAPSRSMSAQALAPRSTIELFADQEPARRRGVLWHLWLERLAWSEDPLPSAAALVEVARQAGLGEIDAREAQEWLTALSGDALRLELSRTQAAKRLGADAGECCLSRERRFAFLREGENGREIVRGAIDRAVVSRAAKRAEVVDFKSDAVAGKDALRERAEEYRPQLELYRTALARLEGIEPGRIDMRVCFVAAGASVGL